MFAALATTVWTRIRRAARLLRAFALLEDGAAPHPHPLPAGAAHTQRSPDVWPRSDVTIPWSALPRTVRGRATSHPGTYRTIERDSHDVRAGMPPAVEPASAGRRLALGPSPVPHPHRRRLAAEHRARRPGTPTPTPMICLSPIVQRDARRGDDRRR